MIKDVLKRQTTIIAVAVIGICLGLIGVSYSIFFDIDKGNTQTITSGTLTVQFAQTKNTLIVTPNMSSSTVGEEVPKSDEEGTKDGANAYVFSVTNNGNLAMNYDIYLYDDPTVDESIGTKLDHQYIKFKLDDGAITTLDKATCIEKKASDLGESGSTNISACKLNVNTLNVAASGSDDATKTHTVNIWVSDGTPESETGKIVALKLMVLGEAGDGTAGGGVIEPLPPEKDDFLAELEDAEDSGQAASDDNENLRYIGQDPNNYIWFNCDAYDFTTADEAAGKNCEKWRIIGLFKNIPKPEGDPEDLVKIIRADSVGTLAWDSANTNNWTNASLKTSLESYYNGSQLSSANGIKQDSTRPMIEQVTWNIGGTGSASGVLASQWYTYERGETVPSGAQTTWPGYIALMYPSDYGYATGGGSMGRDACLAKDLYNWDTGNYKTDCAGNDWLFISGTYQWTLTPASSSSRSVFIVGYIGSVSYNGAVNTRAVRPSLYLKSNVQIANGKGTSDEPYIPNVA